MDDLDRAIIRDLLICAGLYMAFLLVILGGAFLAINAAYP